MPIVASGLLVANVASAETDNNSSDLLKVNANVNANVNGNSNVRGNMMRNYNENNDNNGNENKSGPQIMMRFQNERPTLVGTVASLSGNTLTVTGKNKNTYTVDGSNAVVIKNNATSTLSSIVVGDTVMVRGTFNGTSLIAVSIRDGVLNNDEKDTKEWKTTNKNNKLPPMIQGNGQPVVGGTISVINGNTLTLTNKSNITYTVNVSGATIYKSNATSSLSNLIVGDQVVVQGSVNGTAITASVVVDQTLATSTNNSGKNMGFFGAMRGFFHSMFGFF